MRSEANSREPRGIGAEQGRWGETTREVSGFAPQTGPASSPFASDNPIRGRILVVDDVSYFRRIARKYLESAGHEVVEASCAVEALEQLSKANVDLVVLDYQLPDIDGLSLFQKIQEDVQLTTLCPSKVPPFILCTAV
jgi:CheY-like chemotaxis protein